MKNNFLLIATICLSTMAIAADQKQQKEVAVSHSSNSDNAVVARNSGDDTQRRTDSRKADCAATAKQATVNNLEKQSQGDPDAPQNQVEYGGGS